MSEDSGRGKTFASQGEKRCIDECAQEKKAPREPTTEKKKSKKGKTKNN